MINVRRANMGFSSTPAAMTSRPLPNFNATRLIQAADLKLPGTKTFNNDPSYVGAMDSSNGTPPPEVTRTRLTDRFPDTEVQPMSTPFSELISTLKMTGVAQITLQPFDGTHLKYPLFKKQFYAMYHNRIDDVVLRMSHLQNLLTDNVKEVVSESIDDPENYELVWKRLDQEYGYTTVQSQSKNHQDA